MLRALQFQYRNLGVSTFLYQLPLLLLLSLLPLFLHCHFTQHPLPLAAGGTPETQLTPEAIAPPVVGALAFPTVLQTHSNPERMFQLPLAKVDYPGSYPFRRFVRHRREHRDVGLALRRPW